VVVEDSPKEVVVVVLGNGDETKTLSGAPSVEAPDASDGAARATAAMATPPIETVRKTRGPEIERINSST